MIKCDARSISNRLPGISMTSFHVDSQLVFAWQAAHSIARGSPAPVHDRGGIRVDTRSETETTRWVFPRMCDGLREIAQAITAPRHVLKLCGTDEALRSALPDRWEIQPTNHFMIATAALLDPRPLAHGLKFIAPGPSTGPASSRPTVALPPTAPRRRRATPSSTTASRPRPTIAAKAWAWP